MNAIEHLTIKLAETSLMQGHPSMKDYDELRALLIAARMDAQEANDPPDWPAPAPDADQPARLDRMQRDSNVLAYAEKLRHALSNQGHSLTLAAAITVAKAMLQPAATAAAPAVGLEAAREDSLRTAAWEPSDAEVLECAARLYCAYWAQGEKDWLMAEFAQLGSGQATWLIQARAALRYARKLFGAEAEQLRERLRETERCWNSAVEEVAKQAARIAELEAPQGEPTETEMQLAECRAAYEELTSSHRALVKRGGITGQIEAPAPSEPTQDDLRMMSASLRGVWWCNPQDTEWDRIAKDAYRIAAQRRPAAPLPAVPSPQDPHGDGSYLGPDEGVRHTKTGKPAAMPTVEELVEIGRLAWESSVSDNLSTEETVLNAIARAILSTAQPAPLPGISPNDVQESFYEGLRAGNMEGIGQRFSSPGYPTKPTPRDQLWEASDARARLAVIPGAEGLGQMEKGMPTELTKYLEQWRAGQMSEDQAERILTMVANWAAST